MSWSAVPNSDLCTPSSLQLREVGLASHCRESFPSVTAEDIDGDYELLQAPRCVNKHACIISFGIISVKCSQKIKTNKKRNCRA